MIAAALRRILPDGRGLPRTFWWLFGATLIDRLGGFAPIYLALYLTAEAGMSLVQAGLVASAQSVGALLGTPVAGVLADRLGRRPLLIAGFALSGLSWLHVAIARGPAHIALAVALTGVAGAVGRPAMGAAVGDVVAPEDRLRAFGLQYWAINFGFACAAVLAGLVARISPPLVFALDAASSLAVAAVLAVFLPPLPNPAGRLRGATARADREGFAAMLRGPLRDARFVRLLLVTLCTTSLFMQSGVPLASALRADGLAELYGPLAGINGLLIVLLQPVLLTATSGAALPRVLAWGAAIAGLGFSATALADSVPGHALAIATWTVGEILGASSMPALVTQLAPPEKRATYQGLSQAAWSAAAFSPALGGLIFERLGQDWLWGGCLALGLLAAALARSVAPRRAVLPTP